jgi:hypothetical protein
MPKEASARVRIMLLFRPAKSNYGAKGTLTHAFEARLSAAGCSWRMICRLFVARRVPGDREQGVRWARHRFWSSSGRRPSGRLSGGAEQSARRRTVGNGGERVGERWPNLAAEGAPVRSIAGYGCAALSSVLDFAPRGIQ